MEVKSKNSTNALVCSAEENLGMKKKILIINKVQFGYHIDTYKYCQYLKNYFDITYLCFDNVGELIYEDDISVNYINYKGSFIQRGLRFLVASQKLISQNNFSIIFIEYFQIVSLLKFSQPKEKFILDIRSGAVGMTIRRRKIYNNLLRWESQFFENITIVSECLKNKLRLEKGNINILPLGADSMSHINKSFKRIHLLYVGTLNHRKIEDTVVGLSLFISENKNISVKYDIVGDGSAESQLLLEKAIKEEKLNNIVFLHGRIKHAELKDFFDTSNIGVSYIPITDYYNCQPPTKTYEYINSGMACIATNTKMHRDLICKENGIICNDTPASFAKALVELFINRANYNSNSIKKTFDKFTWKSICENKLMPFITQIIKQ